MRNRKKRFFFKLALFLLPLALLMLSAVVLAIYSGEAMPLFMVIDWQSQDPSVLYQPRYDVTFFGYKVFAAIRRQPGVLMLGSSRSIVFRAELFNRAPSIFYNGGSPGWRIGDEELFLNRIDGQIRPDVVLFELDQTWFNPRDPVTQPGHPTRYEDEVDFNRIWQATKGTVEDVVAGRVGLATLFSRTDPSGRWIALGLDAMTVGGGFRNDGSFALQARSPVPVSHQLEQLEKGRSMFIPGDQVSEERLQRLAQILQFCQERGIIVIGFMPPYAPTVYSQMITAGKQGYILQAEARLPILFADYGFAFYDFTNPAPLGLVDEDFYDGWHGSEYAALQMYIEMLRQSPDVLGRYSNLDTLQALAQQSPHDVHILDLLDNPSSDP